MEKRAQQTQAVIDSALDDNVIDFELIDEGQYKKNPYNWDHQNLSKDVVRITLEPHQLMDKDLLQELRDYQNMINPKKVEVQFGYDNEAISLNDDPQPSNSLFKDTIRIDVTEKEFENLNNLEEIAQLQQFIKENANSLGHSSCLIAAATGLDAANWGKVEIYIDGERFTEEY